MSYVHVALYSLSLYYCVSVTLYELHFKPIRPQIGETSRVSTGFLAYIG